MGNSRQFRRRIEREQAKEVARSIQGEGLEPLTPELRAELEAEGYSAEVLDLAEQTGAMYNRRRRTFFTPPEIL